MLLALSPQQDPLLKHGHVFICLLDVQSFDELAGNGYFCKVRHALGGIPLDPPHGPGLASLAGVLTMIMQVCGHEM
jgi:hypothetical protein